MLQTSLRTAYLLIYLFIASQGIFYFVGVHKALSSISINAFAEQRKAVDLAVAGPLKFLYLSGMILGAIVLFLLRKHYLRLEYVTFAISFFLLALDLTLAVKENVPINQAFHHYSPSDRTTDWNALRAQWLHFILIRGGLAVAGLLTLLAGFVYPKISAQ